MATRRDLELWICLALKSLGGSSSIVSIAQHIWDSHEAELRSSGDLFYTWQYDMRWAANRLRRAGKLKPAKAQSRIWELA
jgi:hypothetical protein